MNNIIKRLINVFAARVVGESDFQARKNGDLIFDRMSLKRAEARVRRLEDKRERMIKKGKDTAHIEESIKQYNEQISHSRKALAL